MDAIQKLDVGRIDVNKSFVLIAPDGTYHARLTSADIYNGKLEEYLKK